MFSGFLAAIYEEICGYMRFLKIHQLMVMIAAAAMLHLL